MTEKQFTNRLEELITIWEQKTPENITQLCAEHFFWYETPFDTPLTTNKELLSEWKNILTQKDIKVFCEVISITEVVGVAHWHATFTSLPSRKKIELDGIFQVTLNSEGRCREFRQWYNSRD